MVLVAGPVWAVVCHMRSNHQRPSATARTHRALADAAKALILAAPGARHRLREVAARLGVSPFHLAHVFRQQTGVPLHKYLLGVRLEMALARIVAGEASLSMLALDLGFSSHSHFTTMFREHFKASPRLMRERYIREHSTTCLRGAICTSLTMTTLANMKARPRNISQVTGSRRNIVPHAVPNTGIR